MTHDKSTVADIVLANSGGKGLEAFDILRTALEATQANGLLGAASDPKQDLTVFAPTDQAFVNLAQVIDPSVKTEADAIATLVSASAALSPEDDPTAFLTTVLSYHVSPGGKTLSDIAHLHEVETLAGTDLFPRKNTLVDQDPDLANPAYVDNLTDLAASNGVVQVIDGVLQPYDITFADGGCLHTGRGPDAVIGSAHNDYISLGRGDDIANGGKGNDWIHGGRGDDLVKGGEGNDRLSGGSGHDIVEGGDGHDRVNGGRGNDIVSGGDGNDRVYGGRGDDHISGGDGHDRVFGGSGNDTASGGNGNDFVSGGRGNDMVSGGDGNDRVYGGRGDDTLIGGSGNDYLKGGHGADKFVFNPNNVDEHGRPLEGHDRIADFNIADGDMLILDVSTFDEGTLRTVAAAAGDESKLELVDLLEASVISLSASHDGDLVIGHPAGTIELDGIPADVPASALIPAVDFMPNVDFMIA